MSVATRKTAREVAISAAELEIAVGRIAALGIDAMRREWRRIYKADPLQALSKDLIARTLTYSLQAKAFGDLRPGTRRMLRELTNPGVVLPRQVKVGSVIVREYNGVLHEVLVVPGGFCWQGQIFDSLSKIAKAITGTNWNGPRFFGLRGKGGRDQAPVDPDDRRSGAASKRKAVGDKCIAEGDKAAGRSGTANRSRTVGQNGDGQEGRAAVDNAGQTSTSSRSSTPPQRQGAAEIDCRRSSAKVKTPSLRAGRAQASAGSPLDPGEAHIGIRASR